MISLEFKKMRKVAEVGGIFVNPIYYLYSGNGSKVRTCLSLWSIMEI